MNEGIYCYAKANTMQEHRFTDDVAICKASSIGEAISKFRQLYSNVSEENVSKCEWNDYGICILTDY